MFAQDTDVCREEASPTLLQAKGSIDRNWVLLDSQSTVDLFYNSKLLVNVRKVSYDLSINCNNGRIKTNMMGDLPG